MYGSPSTTQNLFGTSTQSGSSGLSTALTSTLPYTQSPLTPVPTTPGSAAPDGAGNTLGTARDLGNLVGARSLTDAVDAITDPIDNYKFSLSTTETVSVFLNGLSAGQRIELLDAAGATLRDSRNVGTQWTATNPGSTGGSITTTLNAGTYYVRIKPVTVQGNPVYDLPGYTLNFQTHNAPRTVTVAASNSALANTADYVATGVNDQEVINRAIADLGRTGGGTVVLMEGTFNISNNVEIIYDNITLTGVGWGSVLRLANGVELEDAGLLRSAFRRTVQNQQKTFFSNQHFSHFRLDGNKAGRTSYTNGYANFGTYADSSFVNIRAHDFPHYGFDPHENSAAGVPTVRLRMTDNLADHNFVDGLTIDNCVDSTFTNNILDSNGRHGINVVTAAVRNLVANNIVTNNGGNGITIQPGTDLSRESDDNKIYNNLVQSNKRSGILVQFSQRNELKGNTITLNGEHGIRLRGAAESLVENNIITNNSQTLDNKYSAIYLDNGNGIYSTRNIVRGNQISSTLPKRHRYGLVERSASDNFNTYSGNTIAGTAFRPTLILGPNSTISVA